MLLWWQGQRWLSPQAQPQTHSWPGHQKFIHESSDSSYILISSYLALVSHLLANNVAFLCGDCFLLRVFWFGRQFFSAVGCIYHSVSFTFIKLCKLFRLTDAVWKFVVCIVLPFGSVIGPLASVPFRVLEVVREHPTFITFVGDAASVKYLILSTTSSVLLP